MLVQIQGHIIDTQFIYHISEVSKETRNFGDKYHSERCIFFYIDAMNKKSRIFIKLSVLDDEGKAIPIEPLREKLEVARQKLIAYWNTSKSEIPAIEI